MAMTYVDTAGYESLAELYQDDFKIGIAVQAIDHWNDPTAEIGNPSKEALIDKSFNSMTFGNEFKPAYNFDPSAEGLFKVDPAAEELLTYGREHGIPVRGHCLVWHSQVNPAFFCKDFKALSGGKETRDEKAELDEEVLVDRETLLNRLQTYIDSVIRYTYEKGFASTIYAWDVVNEAMDEGQPDGLRHSYWYRIIGPEFLYYSFLYTREAQVKYAREYASLYGLDPEQDDLSPIMAELFYNDYNEWFPQRVSKTVETITQTVFNEHQSMVQSAVIKADGDGTIFGDGLLDGIGMQGHLDDTQDRKTYMKALEAYNDAVGLVHITELDVGETGSGDKGEYKQARFYYDFFTDLINEVRSGVNLECVTLWGLTDDASWRRGANPLLFRKNLETKPAFDAMVMAAKGAPFTLQEASPVEGASADHFILNFEPYEEDGKMVAYLPETTGFVSRGSGHQAALSMTHDENHTPDVKMGFSLKVSRNEQDATVKMDMTPWIGKIADIGIWVKTADGKAVMGLDSGETIVLCEKNSDGGWVHLQAQVEIPENLETCALYVETDGNADLFLDDVTIDRLEQLPTAPDPADISEVADTAEAAELAVTVEEQGILELIWNFIRNLF